MIAQNENGQEIDVTQQGQVWLISGVRGARGSYSFPSFVLLSCHGRQGKGCRPLVTALRDNGLTALHSLLAEESGYYAAVSLSMRHEVPSSLNSLARMIVSMCPDTHSPASINLADLPVQARHRRMTRQRCAGRGIRQADVLPRLRFLPVSLKDLR
jgi:hypothetical protein